MSEEREKSLELIYDEIFHQYQGAFRSFQTMRERTGQIMGFIGVILNLEILAILQIKFSDYQTHNDWLIIVSLFFLIISLIVAMWAYRQIPFESLTSKECLKEEYKNKTKSELLEIINESRVKDIKQNKKLIHERANCIHVSLYIFTASIISAAIFFIINFSDKEIIFTALVSTILISAALYLVVNHNFSKIIK